MRSHNLEHFPTREFSHYISIWHHQLLYKYSKEWTVSTLASATNNVSICLQQIIHLYQSQYGCTNAHYNLSTTCQPNPSKVNLYIEMCVLYFFIIINQYSSTCDFSLFSKLSSHTATWPELQVLSQKLAKKKSCTSIYCAMKKS